MTSFIPVLKYQNGFVEVFTTKFSGVFYDNMKDAKLAVKLTPDRFWHCDTEDVAKMRARDKICCDTAIKAKAKFLECN